MTKNCPVCNSALYRELLALCDYPVEEGVFYDSRQAAINCPKRDIRLFACEHCAFVGNEDFQSQELRFDTSYNISLHHSPLYEAFIEQLVTRLIDDHDLHDKTILEIGCGKGEFLRQICDQGPNHGIGFDPTVEELSDDIEKADVEFIRDYYSASYSDIEADFIACRHVLEVVENPPEFIESVRHASGSSSRAVFYFEVPNGAYTFSDLILWNLAYTNRSYFYPETLKFLFERYGFDVLRLEPCFQNDQYLGIEVQVADLSTKERQNPTRARAESYKFISEFPERFIAKKIALGKHLEHAVPENSNIVVWGAGARAISFFQLYSVASRIDHVVDINPGKQGKYVPGSGQLVVDPSTLRSLEPDLIVITNHSFENEIRSMVTDLGLECDFISLS